MTGPDPPARLIDLTRLISRVGRGAWTGIDRVEAAWLGHLLEVPGTLFGLVRRGGRYFLLDRAGVQALTERLTGATTWGAADLRARLRPKARPALQAAEADLRRLARAQSGARGLAKMLARALPRGTVWLNVGHSNLGAEMFDAVHRLGGRTVVLVHDTIPLDSPEWQRPGSVAGFTARMRAVARKADLVICISEAARAGVVRNFEAFGRVPALVVAPIGVAPAAPDPAALPALVDLSRPCFATVGTIEPRKNHALLLDIWEDFAERLPAAEVPALHIIGARGWGNEAVFARLDASPLIGCHMFEHPGLTDGAVSALVQGARALLMPSLAEGFGLPPAEALALGTPVIASDLAVYRETLGNNPVYLGGHDMYSWAKEILEYARGQKRGIPATPGSAPALPSWQAHFDLVFKEI